MRPTVSVLTGLSRPRDVEEVLTYVLLVTRLVTKGIIEEQIYAMGLTKVNRSLVE